MNRAFGKVFKSENGIGYGVIRKTKEPFPEVLSASEVLAEDDCGNYLVLLNDAVCFWDHETNEIEVLSNSIDEFVSRCSTPEEVELEPGQVESAWIDPKFAKKFGITSKS
ncbi:SMI1/KNR4 family protein [Celerinatantimonas sp. MCCC 1A17872]|uniref:SMI1/KNR4 family protein n=1 Tax=Celerinatantimonas sp. MCCC 1A17872 TaxID=3177514 RepID=UPI0038C30251